jgi:hypothetical protein
MDNDSIENTINKIECMPAVASPLAIEKTIRSIVSQQSALDKAMATMAKMSAIDMTVPSFTLQQSVIDKAMAAMASPLAIEKNVTGIY